MPGVGRRLRNMLHHPPLRFQVRGVRFLERSGGRALIGDDMGLGKTYQTIAWLALHPELRPAVIVCPSSMKYAWQRELMEHAGLESSVLEGRDSKKALRGGIWILNYAILPYWTQALLHHSPKVLVIDECQYIKNLRAKRTVACRTLGRKVPHIVALSGTPITSRPVEFFSILNLLDPERFPSLTKYGLLYCDAKPSRWHPGLDYSGASNLDQLRQHVSHLMIRRLKEDVLPELPKKRRITIPVRLENWESYREAEQNFLHWLRKHRGTKVSRRASRAMALVKIGYLKRIAGEGKTKAILEHLDLLLQNPKQKVVVFGYHHSVLDKLEESCGHHVRVDGKVPLSERAERVERFQQDPRCRVFLANFQAAGVGLTLTAADKVIFAELGWTPAEHNQAEDRVLRIGQKSDSVCIYRFVGRNTIEERILRLLESKAHVVGQILDGRTIDVLLEELSGAGPSASVR